MEQFRITNLDNGIQIGDKTYPSNYYIVVDKEGDDVQLKLAGNEIEILTRWQNFEDSAGDPYASKAEVIAALILNNSYINELTPPYQLYTYGAATAFGSNSLTAAAMQALYTGLIAAMPANSEVIGFNTIINEQAAAPQKITLFYRTRI